MLSELAPLKSSQPDTQAWIAEYGKGRYDDDSLFFPVQVGSAGGSGSVK